MQHVGFVLTRDDPFTIIDLDNPFERSTDKSIIQPTDPDYAAAQARAERHRRIFQAFDSYAELSQSGQGIHIVVYGSIPSGVRRDKVELYSDARYMICTGNVINNIPITNHQPLLETIHSEMASTIAAELVEQEAVMTDDELFTMATNAANGEKFTRLCNGDMDGYASQSEADFALLTILCFYSKSDSQVRRLFRCSALGKREKATRNDDYINRALEKIRGRQAVPSVDISALLGPMLPGLSVVEPVPEAPPPVQQEAASSTPLSSMSLPPGLIGEVTDYIYSSAIRPVPEIALTAALAMVAGVVGRSYNISSTGLNQYIVLLARTGMGKEGAAGGIDALVTSVRSSVPMAEEFLGPGTFASGQALTRVLDKNPCFVSVLGEFGLTLQKICAPNASGPDLMLRKVLLDIFAKSGFNKWLRPSAYSDQEKNTQTVRAPNVTILGESTPENFYGALEASHISEGLVPRFLVIEHTGLRPPKNPNAFHPCSHHLMNGLRSAFELAITTRANETCCPVQVDRWALGLLDEFDKMADDKINNASGEIDMQLWNRAHLKALKLAGLIAVGCNLHQPIVTKDHAEWAIDLVSRDILNISSKFSTGAVGQGDHQQENDIRAAVERYPQLTEAQRVHYKVPKLLLDKPQLIPYAFLKRYLSMRASFKNDKRGAVNAMQSALGDMVRAGMMMQIPALQAKTDLGVDSPVYYRGESW